MVNYELIEEAVKNGKRIPADAMTFTSFDPNDYMGVGGSLKEFMDIQKDMHLIYLENKINELENKVNTIESDVHKLMKSNHKVKLRKINK